MDKLTAQVFERIEFSTRHADDQGLEITIKHSGPNQPSYLKRVEAEGQVIWYHWLSGAKRWDDTLEGEQLETVYQAGISKQGEVQNGD